jgi:hypothetical protein
MFDRKAITPLLSIVKGKVGICDLRFAIGLGLEFQKSLRAGAGIAEGYRCAKRGAAGVVGDWSGRSCGGMRCRRGNSSWSNIKTRKISQRSPKDE